MFKENLVVFVKKQTDRIEIDSIINAFDINRVFVFFSETSDRISLEDIKKWDIVKDETDIFSINLSSISLAEFVKTIKNLNSKYIALPIGHHKLFYWTFLFLNKRRYLRIQISDGFIDAYPLFESILGARFRNFFGLLKSFIMFPVLYFAKADLCFFQLYPLKSCYSKSTLPIIDVVNKMNLNVEESISNLIIPSSSISINKIIEVFGEMDYISTSKHKEINISGKVNSLDTFITAEDVINNYQGLEKIISTLSTVVIYSAIKRPDLEVVCCLDGTMNKIYGKTYEYSFQKLCKTINVKVIRLN
ncbi:hypothetical protein [Flavicella marina]|uniref:hypothetical protein n=1 Tax=Flavicella marina TaxID=1475951 RepID=UPI001263F5DB|nr:hypothetical protein [Flavicella marina]